MNLETEKKLMIHAIDRAERNLTNAAVALLRVEQEFDNAGIPIMDTPFHSLDKMLKRVLRWAEVLGRSSAQLKEGTRMKCSKTPCQNDAGWMPVIQIRTKTMAANADPIIGEINVPLCDKHRESVTEGSHLLTKKGRAQFAAQVAKHGFKDLVWDKVTVSFKKIEPSAPS